MSKHTFAELGLSSQVLESLHQMGFEAPTSIQEQTIPLLLSGKDVLGQSQTGTGKTAAFAVPVIEKTDVSLHHVQVLIQCPTRELAIQVTGEINKLAKHTKGLHVVPVYGGQHISHQIKALKRGAQVVVGTPGRTLDHLKRGTISLDCLNMVIFDEADEMLNMGFREDMEEIMGYTTQKPQMVMFSATVPKPIREIANRFMNNPASVQVERTSLSAPDIGQFVVEVRDSVRVEAICRLMDVHNFKLGLIFCNTKIQTESVSSELQARGYSCEVLNGDLTQMQRDKVMQRFRSGGLDMLIATDVAARGIDVDDIDVVFNYDIPQDPENYVHRIGRTGRAGRKGTAFTFATGKRMRSVKFIERLTNSAIEKLRMPSLKDVKESRMNFHINEITETLSAGDLKPFIEQIESNTAFQDFSTIEIAAALLKLRIEQNEKDRGSYDEQADFLSTDNDFSRNDRGDRGDRGGRGSRGERGGRKGGSSSKSKGGGNYDSRRDENMVTLRMNVGRKDQIRPGDIVGAIAGESGIAGHQIGHIDIQPAHSFVDIPADQVENVIRSMKRAKVKKKVIKIKEAKST
ncbi:MAG: DEAD/DEAH box helicase [Balneolales bacterium]|nr:DEAD/DEAH box helicase [Balneolales bacterium]